MKRFAGRKITPCVLLKMLSLLLCLCRIGDAYGQSTVYGSVTDKNAAPLAGVHVLLYPAGDSINHVAIDVTDTLGTFRLPLIPDGEYQLVTKYIGMKTVTQSLTVSGKDLAVGTIRMQEADNRLGEVAVKAKIPEWTIMQLQQIEHAYFTKDNPHQILDRRQTGLNDFEGRWQWKSTNGDTILTIELCEAETIYQSYRRSKGIDHHWISLKRIYSYLIGRYEYQVKDSILFSSMRTPIKLRETLTARTIDNRNQWPQEYNNQNQDLLMNGKWFPRPINGVYLKQNWNPFSRHRAWIRLTLLNAEKTLLHWHTDVFMGTSSGALHIRKALKGELGLPNDIVLKKIGDVDISKRVRNAKTQEQ